MPVINDGLSTYHLSTGTHRTYQPAKGNFFEFIVTGLGTADAPILKPGVDRDLAQDSDYITNGQEIIRLTINSAGIPHFSLGDIEIRKGNSVVHYAGVPTFEETSIEVDDMIGAQSKAVLEAWQALVYDVVTDKGGRAAAWTTKENNQDVLHQGYKYNAEMVEYTADHVRVRSWKLIGCWVREISEDDYNKENDDLRRVTATIRYDRAIPVVENV